MDGLIAFSAVRGKQLLPLVKVNDLHRQYRADRGGRAPPITVPQNHWRYYVISEAILAGARWALHTPA
jgi:hypothetical protein